MSSAALFVMFVAAPPDDDMTYPSRSPPRSDVNAICEPSGDQFAYWSIAALFVGGVGRHQHGRWVVPVDGAIAGHEEGDQRSGTACRTLHIFASPVVVSLSGSHPVSRRRGANADTGAGDTESGGPIPAYWTGEE